MNIRNGQNTIPLHVALARGAKSCVGLLLYAGANYNLQVYLQYFEIPLHHLCYHIHCTIYAVMPRQRHNVIYIHL